MSRYLGRSLQHYGEELVRIVGSTGERSSAMIRPLPWERPALSGKDADAGATKAAPTWLSVLSTTG